MNDLFVCLSGASSSHYAAAHENLTRGESSRKEGGEKKKEGKEKVKKSFQANN